MNRVKFENLLQESRTPVEAATALLMLYDIVVEMARKTESQRQLSLDWCVELYKIQQALVWSPLRLFWQPLTEDELLPIRAAAKGNIAERTGEFWADHEVGLMAHANLPIMLSPKIAEILQSGLRNRREFMAAERIWSNGNIKVQFEPILRVTVVESPSE